MEKTVKLLVLKVAQYEPSSDKLARVSTTEIGRSVRSTKRSTRLTNATYETYFTSNQHV
jgi:hypothetical protein